MKQTIPALAIPAVDPSVGMKSEVVKTNEGSGGINVGEEVTQEGIKEPVGGAVQASLEALPSATATADAANAGREEGGSQEAKEEDRDVHSTQPPQAADVPLDT
jgi:hypothetical protein